MNSRFDQTKFKLEWIPCKFLSVVWVQAQRRYNEGRVKDIAGKFDPELFNPVRVTLPNGNGIYHICDGQHGKGAVEHLYGPEEKVPCLVAPEGDPVRAAKLFLRMNTSQKPPSQIDHFKVSVVAREPVETSIDRIVRHHGFRVENRSAPKVITAVAALKAVFRCGPKVLDQTLGITRQIWPDLTAAMGGSVLRGMGTFLNEFGSYIDVARLVEVTQKKWNPETLVRDAKALKATHGWNTTEAVVQLLMTQYNHGIRKGALKRKPSK